MPKTSPYLPAKPRLKQPMENRCLSCGTTENMARRRYCSVACRQALRFRLESRAGLLKALNTRYATFYFTETSVILDVLPRDAQQIFSFIFPRSSGIEPAEDFRRMADILGNAWWAEQKRTRKRYLASRKILSEASGRRCVDDTIRPIEIRTPAIGGKAVMHLKLTRKDLDEPRLHSAIKSAYRRHAMQHHPDRGGSPAAFRKIRRAYEDLLDWAENPVFVRRRGFPDKWFYDGAAHRWVQPTPRGDASKKSEKR